MAYFPRAPWWRRNRAQRGAVLARALAIGAIVAGSVFATSSAARAACVEPSDSTHLWPLDYLNPNTGGYDDLVGFREAAPSGAILNTTAVVCDGVEPIGALSGLSTDEVSLSSSEFTIVAWVIPAADAHGTVVSFGDQVSLLLDVGEIIATLCDDELCYTLPTGNVLTADQPVLIALSASFADDTVRVYVDGAEVFNSGTVIQGSQLAGDGTESYYIAGRSSTNTDLGIVDEVQVYSRVLTTGELTSVFDAGSDGICKPGLYSCSQKVPALSVWPRLALGCGLALIALIAATRSSARAARNR